MTEHTNATALDPSSPGGRHLTVAQAAQELACSRKFVYEAVWSRALPHLKIGRSIRIDREDWERFLRSLRE